MQRHTMLEMVNHNRSTAFERSVKYVWETNRFYVVTTISHSSSVVYTKHLFSPREGLLTHQCNISKKIKIQQIQT